MFAIVDIVLEANPDSFELLCQRARAFALKEDPQQSGAPSFVRLKQIDQLHFMSLQIFQDRHFDPLLVIESNFDGASDDYWRQVLQHTGEDLRAIFACTKPASQQQWLPLFTEGSTLSLVPFIKAYSITPSASHVGALGMTLGRINRDRNLFDDLQAYLGTAALDFRGLTTVEMHQKLRQWVLPRCPWLDKVEPQNIKQEKASRIWTSSGPTLLLLLAAIILVLTTCFLCFSDVLPNRGHGEARRILIAVAVATILGAAVFIACFWKILRRLEASDMTQDDPHLDPLQLEAFAALEDQIVQNHLAHMALVKPGAVRSVVLRLSLHLLKLYVAVGATDGYLSSMRTIHFAHWTLVGNSGRLIFLSNFDGSWQSYLDDFVDKAHEGLTLAWANCIGFPRTRSLIYEGATHGRQFKAWARQAQTQSILWYSAYADLTVNQILRNAAIVDGLRETSLTPADADVWAQLL